MLQVGGGSFYQALPRLFLIAVVLTKPSALSDSLSISSGQKNLAISYLGTTCAFSD